MKTILLTTLILVASILFAQVPNVFKYQVVTRNSSGEVLQNQDVSFRMSILQDGTTVYTETFSETTNDFGLVNLNIGEGIPTLGDFSIIDWSDGAYFLKTELDETGGASYSEIGTSTLVTVPFAMYSKDVENKQILNISNDTLFLTDGGQVYLGNYVSQWQQNSDGIYFDEAGKYVGVGTDNLTSKFVVQGDITSDLDSALFEVKNRDGQTIFAVYDGGVRIYVNDDPAKANTDKGGFAVGGYRTNKSISNEYMRVTPDSVRIYIREDDGTKANTDKGGFAVGGYRTNKAIPSNYFNIFSTDTFQTITPSEPRILWYPLKEAFLVGRILIEDPDSVGLNSFSTGFESMAKGDYSQAMGSYAKAVGLNSTAIGNEPRAQGLNSYAFGTRVLALDTNSYAFGIESAALAKGSFVFGDSDTASAPSAMALGYSNNARGVASLALGAYSNANDTLSVAMGYMTVSDGVAAVAMGDQTLASGSSSLAMGSQTIASGETSTAMGNNTVASGISSIAMGHYSRATAVHAIAMGDSTMALNDDALAMGYKTVASGHFSTSMGYMTLAQGETSFAIGSETQANGNASISMGTNTQANGDASLSIGIETKANGEASISLGANCIADGNVSASFGVATHATALGSFVVGSFNDAFSPVNSVDLYSEIFVIGNGIDMSNTHNAFTVLKSGFIGVNTNTPDKLFTVNGNARVTGDLFYGPIGSPTTYTKADYVFQPDYKKYLDIKSVEKFIKNNSHLPWLTSAKDEKEGVNMTRMSFETLEAVENLQLQIIELNDNLLEYQDMIKGQQKIIEKQQKAIDKIEKKLKK